MENHLIAPFLIEREEPLLVKPWQPSPSPLLSLSTIDNDPNLEIICQTIHVYCANNDGDDQNNGTLALVDHHSRSNPALVLQEALSKALFYYYPLAGRLKRDDNGKLQLNCTGEGVPFVAAKANCTLASLRHLNGVNVDYVKEFVFELTEDDDLGVHPLMIQVTQFSCGGFTVGMGLSHSVCDGFGSAQFFRAMSELASGKSEPEVKPVWERERLVASVTKDPMKFPIDNASLATSPHLPSSDLLHESFNVDKNSIRRLKLSLMMENSCKEWNENFTTLEVLAAYVWRAKFRALELNLDGKTSLTLALGIRNVLDPPLPLGYYGNAFVGSHTILDGKDISEGPLSRVAKLIKESKKKTARAEYVWPWLEFLEIANRMNAKIQARGACTVITDWRHMGLFEVDFGWKNSVNVIPVPWNMLGHVDLCIFLPPCSLNPSMEGGVRVLVCLPRAAMAKFKVEMDSIKFIEERV